MQDRAVMIEYAPERRAVDTLGDEALLMLWQVLLSEKVVLERSNQGMNSQIMELNNQVELLTSDKTRLSATITELDSKIHQVGEAVLLCLGLFLFFFLFVWWLLLLMMCC
jgi:hypothetical protein